VPQVSRPASPNAAYARGATAYATVLGLRSTGPNQRAASASTQITAKTKMGDQGGLSQPGHERLLGALDGACGTAH
jgi:hypothetical protein